jgi:hypothetical protein
MDYPPKAVIPVYENKAYVKVLRIPKNLELNFKNDEYYSSKKSKEKNVNEREKDILKNSQSAKGSPNLIFNDPLVNSTKGNSSGNVNPNQRSNHPVHGKSNEPRLNDGKHEPHNPINSDNNIHRVDLNTGNNNKNSRSTSNDKVGNGTSSKGNNAKGDNRNMNNAGSFGYAGLNFVPDDIDFSKISSNLKDTPEISENKYKDIRNSKGII